MSESIESSESSRVSPVSLTYMSRGGPTGHTDSSSPRYYGMLYLSAAAKVYATDNFLLIFQFFLFQTYFACSLHAEKAALVNH